MNQTRRREDQGKQMSQHVLKSYIDLIRLFLTFQITSATFEHEYLTMFKNDLTRWEGEEYEVLNDLFGDLDAFCGDADLREPGDLDEEQLRESAQAAINKLLFLEKRSE